MFIWDGTLRNVCSRLDSNWIHHSIRVFEGDFTNPGDLDKIVDTCLGLSPNANLGLRPNTLTLTPTLTLTQVSGPPRTTRIALSLARGSLRRRLNVGARSSARLATRRTSLSR